MNIKLFFCGGTISSATDNNVISLSKEFNSDINALFQKYYPKHKYFTKHICNKHSENYFLSDISLMIGSIKEGIANMDGAIVFCGTDTLAYTAAYLYYGLDNIKIPVILVSANYILSHPKSNGRDNISLAVKMVEEQERGVFVAYRNEGELPKLFVANTLLAIPCFSDRVLAFPCPYAVWQDNRLVITDKMVTYNHIEYNCNNIRPCVVYIVSAIGLDFSFYLSQSKQPKAYMIECFHSSTVTTEPAEDYASSINDFAKQCAANGVEVYLAGFEKKDDYYHSSSQIDFTIIKKVDDMTPIALQAMLNLSYSSQ